MSGHEIPVFVGITGKRVLHANPAENERLTAIVRARIDAVLDRLDIELPEVTKVLLTSGTAGADLIAARHVLGLDGARSRPMWLVAVVLPLSRALFREDFDAPEWEDLEEVLGHPRARCTELPPLRTGLTPSPAFAANPLSRNNPDPAWQQQRRLHYEQVGLWIADTANILIAAMCMNERTDNIGGTARVVAYRCSGRPDAIARAVIDASEASLVRTSDFMAPPRRYVWLVDATADAADASLPISLLSPTLEMHTYEYPAEVGLLRTTKEHIRDAIAEPKAIQRIFACPKESEFAATWPDSASAESLLQAIRTSQFKLRRQLHRLDHLATNYVGITAVLPVLAFEMFAKFFAHASAMLLPYIGFTLMAGMLKLMLGEGLWHQRAAFAIAMSELLRLQRAWWLAGVTARVDHVLHFALLRDATRNAIVWAQLAGEPYPVDVRWAAVWQPGLNSYGWRRDWIGEQIYYLILATPSQERRAKRMDALSGNTSVVPFWLAIQLYVLLTYEKVHYLVDNAIAAVISHGTPLLVMIGFTELAIAITALVTSSRIAQSGFWPALLRMSLTFLAAAALAASLRICGELLAGAFGSFADQHHAANERFTLYLIIVAIALLPPIAEAMHLVADKHGYEAQAISARAALGWFEQTDKLLHEQMPGMGDAAADARARAILKELGRLLVVEIEGRVSAQRDRPLTPVIGG